MAQNVIAVICDCDGTLCPDTASRLVSELGLDPQRFWREVAGLVEGGWDPPLAWLNRLLDLARSGQIKPITREKLQDIGRSMQCYAGTSDFVERLRQRLGENVEFRDADVTVHWYIVSSGIEEILRATPVGALATDVFGCELEYDGAGNAVAVKGAVSFTEKTKFIFAINKGISGEQLRRNPYRVNDALDPADRPVPFEHMVYIGDGPSDIPCFSLIKAQGGRAIGVMPPEDLKLRRPYELAEGKRLTVGPYTADYGDTSDLFKMLWRIVEGIADSIVEKRAHGVRPAPRY